MPWPIWPVRRRRPIISGFRWKRSRQGSRGTENALRLAEAKGARFLLASTSEVYGDPAVHPQTEEYWGHVNPIGPRSVYDEAKRFAEALTVPTAGPAVSTRASSGSSIRTARG